MRVYAPHKGVRELVPRRSNPRRASALGLWLLALVLGWVGVFAGVSVGQAPDPAFRGPTITPQVLHDQLLAGVRAGRRHDPIPAELAASNPRSQKWEPRFCKANFEATTTKICPLGDVTSKRVVVALGDSHMGHWLEALDRDGEVRHYKVIPLVKFGCPPYHYPIKWGRGTYTACDAFRAWTARKIRDLRPAAVVVTSIVAYDRIAAGSRTEAIGRFRRGVRSRTADLLRSSRVVVLMGDLSELGWEPEDCISDPGNDLGDCMWKQSGDPVDGNTRLRRIAVDLGARFVSTTSLVCADGTCPLVAAGRLTYSDHGHVAVPWAGHVSPVLGRKLRLAPLPQ